MNKYVTEQTDALESIVSEVGNLNELVYAGWSLESMSRFVTKDNVEEICTLLRRLSQTTDRNTKVYVLSTGGGQ
ncbi:MAG: hypothetical protein P8J80_04270 [Porticoccaceae bacterium]|nr:hypothetical protein [Porticoccaceae bacterium]